MADGFTLQEVMAAQAKGRIEGQDLAIHKHSEAAHGVTGERGLMQVAAAGSAWQSFNLAKVITGFEDPFGEKVTFSRIVGEWCAIAFNHEVAPETRMQALERLYETMLAMAGSHPICQELVFEMRRSGKTKSAPPVEKRGPGRPRKAPPPEEKPSPFAQALAAG